MIWQLYFSCVQQKVNNGLLNQSEASFHFSLGQFWREWFKKGMGRRWETLKEDLGFTGGSVVRPANAEDVGLIPESRGSPGGENDNLLQYSCLENPMTEEPDGLLCQMQLRD